MKCLFCGKEIPEEQDFCDEKCHADWVERDIAENTCREW